MNNIRPNSTSSNPSLKNADAINIQDIRDLTDINKLSVKQLKIILTRNCIDFRGIFEKEVLQEKVTQLWIDHNERKTKRQARQTETSDLNKTLDDIDESDICKICMEEEINCVLLECGHQFTCVTCGRKMAECPICRQNVTRCVRIFKV